MKSTAGCSTLLGAAAELSAETGASKACKRRLRSTLQAKSPSLLRSLPQMPSPWALMRSQGVGARSSQTSERRVLADAPAMRVDAPLSLRGYAEDDGDEDDVV